MKCSNCGSEQSGNSAFCVNCGAKMGQNNQQPPQQNNAWGNPPPQQQYGNQTPPPNYQGGYAPPPPAAPDKVENGCLMGGLCFWIPILGIILYFVYKDKSPLTAKHCLKWGIISIVVSVVGGIVFGIIYSVVLSSALSTLSALPLLF